MDNKTTVKQLKHLQGLVRLITSTEKLPLKDLLGSEGNRKIPSSTAIFNLSPAKLCPSKKLGLCAASLQGAKCYANKAEILYPNVLPYRMRQMEFWKNVTANEFVKQFLLIQYMKVNPFNALRINESGDFSSQKDVDKAEEVARLLNLHGVKVYCYTSRKDLDFRKCKNLVVSGSNFKAKGINNIFKIVKDIKDKPKGWAVCCGSCRKCRLCMVRGSKVVVKSH